MPKKLEVLPIELKCTHAPVVQEVREPTGIDGVELFLHAFVLSLREAPMRTSRFTIDPDCGTREDRHAVSELWFISRGELDVAYDGKCFRIKAGQVVFFPPWKLHSSKNAGKHRAEVFSLWWAQS